MGRMKHLLAENEYRRDVATSIAVKAKVLERCEFHEDNVYLGSNDLEAAYRLGNAMFSAKTLDKVFSERREMTDAIKSAVESISADECDDCRQWASE